MSAHTPPAPRHGPSSAPLQLDGWELADRLGDMISRHAPDGTYRYASAAARELLGYEPAELVGTWAYDHFHPDDVPKVSGAHRSVLGGAPETVVYRLRRKCGAYAWVETTTRVIGDDAGEPVEIVCSTRPLAQRAPGRPDDGYEACVARVGALLRDRALTPVFQPIVDLEHDRRAIAYEALSRFPGDAAHTPDRWFADAWQVDLGVALELLAIEEAVAAIGQLPPDVALAVNASPETVAAVGFCDALGGAANRVVVEVTEHRRLDDDAFQRKLAPLRAAGGQVAIDDFGAGHASLSQVLALSPDWIKLDLSLTRQLDSSPVARALAASLVSFAAEVGVGVVAEGVEEPAQVDLLRGLGIRYAQGYLFGRPAPIEALLSHIA